MWYLEKMNEIGLLIFLKIRPFEYSALQLKGGKGEKENKKKEKLKKQQKITQSFLNDILQLC